MSDTIQKAEYFNFHHTTDESIKDKDQMKQQFFESFTTIISGSFIFPIGFSIWQLKLINNPQKLHQYKNIRIAKYLSFGWALGLAFYHQHDLQKKWRYCDRLFPEATGLQRALLQEAEMMRL